MFQELLREIEEYRANLDRVNMKGRRLIDNNPKTPRLAQQMQSQLQNLEESYVNLQATAEQIRVSNHSLTPKVVFRVLYHDSLNSILCKIFF